MRLNRIAILGGLALVSVLAACGGTPSAPTTLPSMPSPPLSPAEGTVVTQVPNEGFNHVPEGTSITYQHNPPASGPHYPVWARYEEYTTPLARGYWVHNLEHGAIVFLHRPDTAGATVDALGSVYRSLPPDPECGAPRALMTPDPLMTRPIAVVAWDWVLDSDVVEAQAILDFVAAHRNHGREDICEGGTRP